MKTIDIIIACAAVALVLFTVAHNLKRFKKGAPCHGSGCGGCAKKGPCGKCGGH